MSTIAENIANVRTRILRAAHAVDRDSRSVTLMAVSKTRPAAAIRQAHAADIEHIGENYLQEALAKMTELQDLPLVWHFIGPIQSNKTRAIAEHFDWVHSVDRLKVAQRLSAQRPADKAPLNICLQVNISAEDSKAGISLHQLPDLAQAVAELPGLRLRGLMAIPAPATSSAERRAPLRALREAMAALPLPLDTLSMGMSDDLDEAIAEGATMVRIGSALFGARDYSTPVPKDD
jgi:pyridoxal phosphate enzyme (YggS family)